MKKTYLLLLFVPILFMASCVSSKKYKALDKTLAEIQASQKDCTDKLNKANSQIGDLTKKNADLQADNDALKKQIDFLKANNAQLLNTMQDMSILTTKQADNIKQSLDNINAKDGYIQNLQSAIQRKDSLNLALVTNLKSALVDVNDKDINIKVDKGVIYVDISDKLLFASGKSDVSPAAKNVLGKVALVLNAHPEIEFLVEGHTDNQAITNLPGVSDNWDLSVKRSTAVIRLLQNTYHINPARMSAGGRSEYVPIADNKTPEGRAQNRRTRIVILPQMDQFFKLLEKK